MWGVLSLCFTLILITGCTTKESTSSTTNSGPTANGPAETAYCSTPITYSGSTTAVTGVAQYKKRALSSGGLGSAAAAANMPIRRAEVRVTDSAGNVVQCSETDGSGNISFTLPRNSATYTVSVNSRASNSYLVASVLNRVEQNAFYSLSTTVVPSGATANLGTLTAAANGSTLGGAFNILDRLLEANEYLRSQVGVSAGGCGFSGCATFTVAPKVSAYWELGFNPNSYYGGTSGLSFYLPGYSRLFILGGINGDVNSSDTDHYDDSVIIHEYGHFLEDSMFVSDSPGGSHNGNRVIDPRLAWSEGWGNFFQAAVRGDAHYIDTYGNADGTTGTYFYADLETADRDIPVAQGDGNFREFSVTRLLWDATDNTGSETLHSGTDNITGAFNQIWASLVKSTEGFKDSNFAFRNIGHLHYAQGQLGTASWSGIRTIEYQDGDTSQYARYMVTGSSCAATTITPDASLQSSSALSSSNYRVNNDFYHIKIISTATYTFRIDYSTGAGTGGEPDLDLYLYNEKARIGNSTDILTYSRNTPDNNTGTAEFEQFSVSLSPGDYLLNVNAFLNCTAGTCSSTKAASYTLKLNGAQLCPGTL